MDDDYELVPKGFNSTLKKENEELKKKLSQLQSAKPKSQEPKQDSKIIEEIKQEGKLEQEIIIKHLESLNKISESTLNNVLDRTQKLDIKTSEMGKSISLLASTITELIEVTSEKEDSKETKNENNNTQDLEELKIKIDNIEKFMKKLETMLSQVKKIE